jgi:hypothetical protein
MSSAQRGGDKMTEKKRIIRVMLAKIKPAYHKLSEEEQQEFMRKDREKMEELGYKLHFMLDCSRRVAIYWD